MTGALRGAGGRAWRVLVPVSSWVALRLAGPGRLAEAEPLFRRALAILEKARDDSSRAVVLRNYEGLVRRIERGAEPTQPEAPLDPVSKRTSRVDAA